MEKEKTKCPVCGGGIRYYHSPHRHEDGVTMVVCAKKCQGWKTIKEISRKGAIKPITEP